jgi:hypothetical protein
MSNSEMTDQPDPERPDSALPDSARTVLLAGPPTDRLRSVCGSLHRADAETDLVIVTYTRTPSDYLADLETDAIGDVVVITVGDAAPDSDEASVAIRQVEAPADLTQLGIEIDEALDGREQVSVCFDSVTTTLQYADYTDVYEFLHAITGRLRAAGARAHVHVNSLAHDEQVLASLTTLFDARIDLLGEDVSVETRSLLADSRNV